MGSPRVNTPQAPAAPTPVDAGQAIAGYLGGIGDPGLQNQLLGLEGTYRPQYAGVNAQSIQNTLLGVGGEGGYFGTLDLQDMAARRQQQLGQDLLTNQRAFDLSSIAQFGPSAANAYFGANPRFEQALNAATGAAGQSGDVMGNALSQMERFLSPQPIIGGFTGPLSESRFRLGPTVTQSGAGGQPVSARDAIANRNNAAMLGQQTGSAITPERVGFSPITSGGTMTPERVAAERIAAERIAAGQVAARDVGAGALGGQLYQQALANQQQSPLSSALQQQALGMATQPGAVSASEMRAVAQGARERSADRGRLGDASSIASEALARAGASRERQFQDLAAAQGINQQLLGASQAGQALATDVLRTDIQRQQANAAQALGAGQFNVQAALEAARANQAAGLQANLANQSTGLQASLANQQAMMEAQRFNITNAQNIQAQNAGLGLQAGTTNAANALAAAESNRNFGAQQQQQYFNNLAQYGLLGQQAGQQNFANQMALAGMQQGVTNNALGLLGTQAPGMGYGAQALGTAMGQAQNLGPALFDPNAGVNLALANNANLANYNANIYGSQAAAADAGAQARGSMMGGVLGAIGTVGGAVIGSMVAPGPGTAAGAAAGSRLCWVAREVYGEDNPKWLQFRDWLMNSAPNWFRELYIKHGERVAQFISNKPILKAVIRRWMDARID